MKIPTELLTKWRDLKSHGDGKKIVEANPSVNATDISRAFKEEECSDAVFKILADFYKEKEDKVKVYL